MPIVINGDGTISGITTGGLPDGIVQTADLADDAVTIAKLSATGTASSSTFLRGDGAFAEAGGGKLLQTATGTTATDTTHSSQTFTDTTLSASITPATTGSKILIMVSQAYEIAVTSNHDSGGSINLLRDSTVIESARAGDGTGNNHKMYMYVASASGLSLYNNYNLTFLDSPNTTSSVTYKTQAAMYSGSDTIKTQASSIRSYITLLEIGA